MTERTAQNAAPEAARRAFEFLNGWADRVFVVTLARALDRQARVRDRLAGLRFELFLGTDKLDLDRDRLVREGIFDERRTPRSFRHRREMSLGEIGCALSHRRIYEAAIRNGWSRVVVLEDDVAPRPADLALLPAALGQLPASWDLCYLGYIRNDRPSAWDRAKRAAYVALSPLRLVPWKLREALRLHPSPFAPNLRRAGLHLCTHAYALSLEGARKLLALQNPVAFRADWALSYLVLRGELSAFVTDPKLFDQDEHPEEARAASSYVHG